MLICLFPTNKFPYPAFDGSVHRFSEVICFPSLLYSSLRISFGCKLNSNIFLEANAADKYFSFFHVVHICWLMPILQITQSVLVCYLIYSCVYYAYHQYTQETGDFICQFTHLSQDKDRCSIHNCRMSQLLLKSYQQVINWIVKWLSMPKRWAISHSTSLWLPTGSGKHRMQCPVSPPLNVLSTTQQPSCWAFWDTCIPPSLPCHYSCAKLSLTYHYICMFLTELLIFELSA